MKGVDKMIDDLFNPAHLKHIHETPLRRQRRKRDGNSSTAARIDRVV
jgi:hypothetical protein